MSNIDHMGKNTFKFPKAPLREKVNMMHNGPKWVDPSHYRWRPWSCRMPQMSELESEVYDAFARANVSQIEVSVRRARAVPILQSITTSMYIGLSVYGRFIE